MRNPIVLLGRGGAGGWYKTHDGRTQPELVVDLHQDGMMNLKLDHGGEHTKFSPLYCKYFKITIEVITEEEAKVLHENHKRLELD